MDLLSRFNENGPVVSFRKYDSEPLVYIKVRNFLFVWFNCPLFENTCKMMLFRHEVGWLLLKYCTQLCAVGSCVLESARKLKSVLDRPNAKSDVFFFNFSKKTLWLWFVYLFKGRNYFLVTGTSHVKEFILQLWHCAGCTLPIVSVRINF